jgi:hypothetical protein
MGTFSFDRKAETKQVGRKSNHLHSACQTILKSADELSDNDNFIMNPKKNCIAGVICGLGLSSIFWLGIFLIV